MVKSRWPVLKGEPLTLNWRWPSFFSEKNCGNNWNFLKSQWKQVICHDFSIPFTPSQKLLPGCWPQYHPRSSHPSSCCGTACVSDKTPRPWRKKRSFFGVRRKTWRLGRFLSLSTAFLHFLLGMFVFYPNPARVFKNRMIDMWNLNHRAQQKLSCFSKYRDSFPLSNFWFCQNFSFIFDKNKKNIANRLNSNVIPSRSWWKMAWCKTAIAWWSGATQSKTVKRAPSKGKNSHGNWKIHGFCFLFGNTSSKLLMFEPCWFSRSVMSNWIEMTLSERKLNEHDTPCLIVVILYFLRRSC